MNKLDNASERSLSSEQSGFGTVRSSGSGVPVIGLQDADDETRIFKPAQHLLEADQAEDHEPSGPRRRPSAPSKLEAVARAPSDALIGDDDQTVFFKRPDSVQPRSKPASTNGYAASKPASRRPLQPAPAAPVNLGLNLDDDATQTYQRAALTPSLEPSFAAAEDHTAVFRPPADLIQQATRQSQRTLKGPVRPPRPSTASQPELTSSNVDAEWEIEIENALRESAVRERSDAPVAGAPEPVALAEPAPEADAGLAELMDEIPNSEPPIIGDRSPSDHPMLSLRAVSSVPPSAVLAPPDVPDVEVTERMEVTESHPSDGSPSSDPTAPLGVLLGAPSLARAFAEDEPTQLDTSLYAAHLAPSTIPAPARRGRWLVLVGVLVLAAGAAVALAHFKLGLF